MQLRQCNRCARLALILWARLREWPASGLMSARRPLPGCVHVLPFSARAGKLKKLDISECVRAREAGEGQEAGTVGSCMRLCMYACGRERGGL